MRPPPQESIDKPTCWVVFIRPIGFPGKPWQEHRIEAQSAAEADTELRRVGYEMQTGTAYLSSECWSTVMPNDPPSVTCTQCGYLLDGLAIDGARVICPECAFGQVIISWSPGLGIEPNKNYENLKSFLATIGLISLILVGIAIVAIIFSI